jgi:hypothetical protein
VSDVLPVDISKPLVVFYILNAIPSDSALGITQQPAYQIDRLERYADLWREVEELMKSFYFVVYLFVVFS